MSTGSKSSSRIVTKSIATAACCHLRYTGAFVGVAVGGGRTWTLRWERRGLRYVGFVTATRAEQIVAAGAESGADVWQVSRALFRLGLEISI